MCVRIRCDNDIVNYALKKKNSNDEFLNDCVRYICYSAAKKRTKYYIFPIRTKVNVMADLL